MRIPPTTLLLTGLFVVNAAAHASDSSDQLRARLKAASELAALDTAAVQPWHWKTDLTIFDKDGNNPKTGEMEIWSSGSNMLTHYAIGPDELSVLRVGNDLYTV